MSDARSQVLIAVDIGNGSAKAAAFENWASGPLAPPLWVMRSATDRLDSPDWASRLPDSPCLWGVVSVHREGQRKLAEWVNRHRTGDAWRLLSGQEMPVPVKVDYPDRVGVDRLAAAVGALAVRRDARPLVVVDSGTALTVDLVSSQGEFLGGAILPGVGMAARALSEQTDALPLVDSAWRVDPPPAVGKNTVAAIESGLYWGAVGAIRELAARFASAVNETRPLPILLTGGDAPILAPRLGPEASAAEHLVHYGIVIAARQACS